MNTIRLDEKEYPVTEFATPHGKLLVIRASNGLLGCGYLNLETAEKLQDALAVVTGVKTPEDLLNGVVRGASSAAQALGVVPGMTGADALRKMSD